MKSCGIMEQVPWAPSLGSHVQSEWPVNACLTLNPAGSLWAEPVWRNTVPCRADTKSDPSVPRGTTHCWIQSPVMLCHLPYFSLFSHGCISGLAQTARKRFPSGPYGKDLPDAEHLRGSGGGLFPECPLAPSSSWAPHTPGSDGTVCDSAPSQLAPLFFCFCPSLGLGIPFISQQICK